jgi:hypothetical protein
MIEAPQPCIGVCEHRRVEFVFADEHEEEIAGAHARIAVLERLLRRMIATHPRQGHHAAALESFQRDAREALAAREDQRMN